VLVVVAVIPKIKSLTLSRHCLELYYECFDLKKVPLVGCCCYQLKLMVFSDSLFTIAAIVASFRFALPYLYYSDCYIQTR
jgi:hypothetical protein